MRMNYLKITKDVQINTFILRKRFHGRISLIAPVLHGSMHISAMCSLPLDKFGCKQKYSAKCKFTVR